MKEFVSAKIHDIKVTHKSIFYHGSVTISADLMQKVDIQAYEKVDVINLNNGERWTTYVVATHESGVFKLNGGGARKGEIGDKCVVITYRSEEKFSGAKVLHCDEYNNARSLLQYPSEEKKP